MGFVPEPAPERIAKALERIADALTDLAMDHSPTFAERAKAEAKRWLDEQVKSHLETGLPTLETLRAWGLDIATLPADYTPKARPTGDLVVDLGIDFKAP